MSNTVISVENLSKEYRLGIINHGTLTHDLQSWWARMRGKEDPNTLIGHHQASTLNPQPSTSFLALNDVSFEVNQGEVLGIIGRNGAGKSTLLKILSQVTAPSKGEVKIKGRIASLLEVGTGFHPELTGRENVFLNGAILGMSKTEITNKFDEIVDFSGVEKFIDTPVKRYSSGMYVRLAFAVAAHLESEILIVDEVLAVGDAQFQKKCLGKMQDVGKEGRTVLFVSHNMAAISALCSRALLLSNGRFDAVGATTDVIDAYLSSYLVDNINVNDRVDRLGSGDAKIYDIYFVDKNSNRLDILISGNNYNLVIKYKTSIRLTNPKFKVSLYNRTGQLIAHFNNWLYDYMPNLPVGTGEAICHLNKLPLASGLYRVNTSLSEDKLLDHIDGAISIGVEDGDYYGTGRVLDDLKEICLIPHSWSIKHS